MFDSDVIIVGAGPAGLWAALELSKKNRKVIVLEKKKSMDSLRRACSMQFIIDDDYEGEGVVVEKDKLVFPKSKFEVPYHGRLLPLYNKYYHSPKDHVMRFANNDGKDPFSYKFDKQFLLKELYYMCIAEGIQIELNSLVRNTKDLGDHIELTAVTSGKKKNFTCRKLIDAEGATAYVAKQLGFNKNRPCLTTALSCKFIVKDIEGVEKNSWNLYYGRVYRSNAAIIIGPSLYGDNYNEVTITSDKNKIPDVIYNEVITDSPLAEKFKNAKLVDKIACSVRAFLPLKEPCKGNALIAGDAAAFVEVETQGGLLCGHHAAAAVEKELNGEDGWSEYTKWWQDSFEFNGDDFMKVSQGYALVPLYTDDEVDYLFGLVEKDCMPGTYSQYKTPKYMWEGIRKYEDKIKAERPEIYAKMQKLDQSSLNDSFSN